MKGLQRSVVIELSNFLSFFLFSVFSLKEALSYFCITHPTLLSFYLSLTYLSCFLEIILFLYFHPPGLSLWDLADSGSRWEVYAVKTDSVFMVPSYQSSLTPFPFFPSSLGTRGSVGGSCVAAMYTTSIHM